MALFDSYQKAVFSKSQTVFGDIAVWNDNEIKVLYNSPNDPIKIGDSDKYEYRPYNYWFEYFLGDFPELKSNVDTGLIEHVLINEIRLVVREVFARYDGKTFIAYCELDPE